MGTREDRTLCFPSESIAKFLPISVEAAMTEQNSVTSLCCSPTIKAANSEVSGRYIFLHDLELVSNGRE